MTIVQFVSAMERYSMDVLAIAFLVCMLTSLLKKGIPKNYKKYLTFLPFLIGIAAYAGYLYINKTPIEQIFIASTVLKGIECGAAATIYYVLYEQFIRGKTSSGSQATDIKTLTVSALLNGFVRDASLEQVSAYIAGTVSGDNDYSFNMCMGALQGKTKPGIGEGEISIMAKLIIKTLAMLS